VHNNSYKNISQSIQLQLTARRSAPFAGENPITALAGALDLPSSSQQSRLTDLIPSANSAQSVRHKEGAEQQAPMTPLRHQILVEPVIHAPAEPSAPPEELLDRSTERNINSLSNLVIPAFHEQPQAQQSETSTVEQLIASMPSVPSHEPKLRSARPKQREGPSAF
jgi:hypothetical protein